MTNLEIIALAYSQFNSCDYGECEKTLNRIKRCFALEHDEYRLAMKAELTQPSRDLAEKLIAEGKGELVGDASYRVSEGYLKYDIQVTINFISLDPYFIHQFDDDDDDDVPVYFCGRVNLDVDGISSISANGGVQTAVMRKELKNLIKKWLNSEFGKVTDYDWICHE